MRRCIQDPHGERGQTVVTYVLAIAVLIGMGAMVVDVGNWYLARRSLQGAVDAAALAGASRVPAGWTTAKASAGAQYAKNGDPGDQVSYELASNVASGDSVKVTATRTVSSIFAGIVGITQQKVSATSRATVSSIVTVVSHGDVMPWGVLKQSFVPGQTYNLYADQGGSPDNGTLLLPSQPNCSGGSGVGAYKNQLDGSELVCDLTVGDLVNTKGGQSAGITQHQLDARITTWHPITDVLHMYGNGYADVIDRNSKQLVVLPVVQQQSGAPGFPGSGNQPMVIVGFADFFITGVYDSGKRVEGVFVGTAVIDDGFKSGPWDPSSGTLITYALSD
jgi:Flp pilus assembly protein TadG